jgi:hypothetical protein
MKSPTIEVLVMFNFKLTFWSALKLRLAGNGFAPIAAAVLKEMEQAITGKAGSNSCQGQKPSQGETV